MRRTVAALRPWWLRLFLAAIPGQFLVDWPWWVEVGILVSLLALTSVRPPRRDDVDPFTARAPVRGRWVAMNSPGSAVPSHGVRAYGQAFAIDILHPSEPGTASTLPWTGGVQDPSAFSCFGDPVRAIVAGTVVAVTRGRRDHRARTTWPAVIYMLTLEGFFREVGGPNAILGNHVILDHGDGVHSVSAHLRRGSITVDVGQRIETGQVVGEIGNSGNTSEPHLHVHLMDDPRPNAAAGLPFRWVDARIEPGDIDQTRAAKPVSTEIEPGLPANGQVFTVLDA